ncbi:NAD(P)H-dependent flavin oxidoreductase [Asticcacaulis solisilvae]|uniref:NAD(P)H-dependent flavin oxidoreductase n=1 Tax=Asticcacaulis solisilvae TaxID=1217274 RepID=UPI003FD7B127
MAWTGNRICQRLGIRLPIVQAPMAGSDSPDMTVAVSEAGGLGSLACGMLSPDRVLEAAAFIRSKTKKTINLNFYCHKAPTLDAERDRRWREEISAYFAEFGVANDAEAAFVYRTPFNDALCAVAEDVRPEVISFHFGLPEKSLFDRAKATGAVIMSSATTVAEAVWLEKNGCDIVIAQGVEAGGHNGMFLDRDVATRSGTLALVPQIVDAVGVPVIAAGGIGDARGIAAAFMLGADGVQLGTAYLKCPEARLNPLHARALASARDDNTALTNVFSGRPARGIVNRLVRDLGPMSATAPDFPMAGKALAALRARAESEGHDDFTNLWAGQSAHLSPALPAADLTEMLMAQAWARLKSF